MFDTSLYIYTCVKHFGMANINPALLRPCKHTNLEYSGAGVRKHSDRLAILVNRNSSSSGIRENDTRLPAIRLCQSLNRCVSSTRTKSWHTKTFPRVRQFNLEWALGGFLCASLSSYRIYYSVRS